MNLEENKPKRNPQKKIISLSVKQRQLSYSIKTQFCLFEQPPILGLYLINVLLIKII